MAIIYHLASCKTCQKALDFLAPLDGVELREIKSEGLTGEELQALHGAAGSYGALFSKRAQLYRQRGLNERELTETEMRDLILEHYTFLKRPVVFAKGQVFTGNARKNLEAARAAIHG